MLEVENFKPFELSTILWHLGHNHGCATAGRWCQSGNRIEIGCSAIWCDLAVYINHLCEVPTNLLSLCTRQSIAAHKICYVYLYIFLRMALLYDLRFKTSVHKPQVDLHYAANFQHFLPGTSACNPSFIYWFQSTLNACDKYFCRKATKQLRKMESAGWKIMSLKILIIYNPLAHFPFFYSLSPNNLPL